MERFIKDYDVYNYFRIGSTDIITFDAHNMALPLWGAMSSILGASLNLVSFDCHTDTHKPFAAKVCSGDPDGMRGYYFDHPIIREILNGKKYQMNNFSFDSVYSIADNSLKNDEHILTAVNFGYIREYTIVCNIEPRYVDQFIRADSFDGYKAVYISKESCGIAPMLSFYLLENVLIQLYYKNENKYFINMRAVLW